MSVNVEAEFCFGVKLRTRRLSQAQIISYPSFTTLNMDCKTCKGDTSESSKSNNRFDYSDSCVCNHTRNHAVTKRVVSPFRYPRSRYKCT
jgi:hypothetical protein